jgi:hypothetical protein
MRRTSYANVVATLALILALGGTSYAATQITGKDVKNGSLSGKDIKDKSLKGTDVKDESLTGTDVKDQSLTGTDLQKQSVPLDRLSGTLPTQADPAQFVPSAGPYTVSVGPGGWQSLSTSLRRYNVFGTWRSSSTDDGANLLLDPVLPTQIAGKPMRLNAVTMCWDATQTATMFINDVIISTWRENASGDPVDIVEKEDVNDQTGKTCKRYAFTTPVTLAADSRVSLRLSIAWHDIGSMIHVGGATLELDRA